jgi:hypothetical protein
MIEIGVLQRTGETPRAAQQEARVTPFPETVSVQHTERVL